MAGRKPNHFVDKNNNQIKGLARRKDGRWRVIGTGQTFVEPDEDLAIHKYLTQYAPRELRRSRPGCVFGTKTQAGTPVPQTVLRLSADRFFG